MDQIPIMHPQQQPQTQPQTAALAASEVSVFENREDLGSGLFCSELAASFYQRLGLLPRYPASNTYIPMDFAASSPSSPEGGRASVLAGWRRGKGLELLQGAHLGEEVRVKTGGRELRATQGRQEEKGEKGTTGQEAGPEAQALIARALRRYGSVVGAGCVCVCGTGNDAGIWNPFLSLR